MCRRNRNTGRLGRLENRPRRAGFGQGRPAIDSIIYTCKCICMETQINLLQALADPARFRIVEAMKSGECAVGDIVERMEIHQSGVSRHLRILSEAGIVQMRPDGQKRLYSLRKEAFDQLEAWVAGYRRHWQARLDRFGAALEQNRAPAKAGQQEKVR